MTDLQSELVGAILAGALSVVLFFFANKRHFFRLPAEPWNLKIEPKHVAAAFAVYIAIFFLSLRFIAPHLQTGGLEGQVKAASLIHLFVYSLTIFAFYIVCLKMNVPIWRSTSRPNLPMEDFKQASIAWAISFPFVLSLQQFFDVILRGLFHMKELPEQIAVYFLKMTLHYPLYFVFALITVIFLAPIAEETLFRGFLQSYLRRFLGSKTAIFLTAFIFAFFHFSYGQGISNLPIVISLFVFASFLGFLYEKQQSLRAPIFLHMLFNAVNAAELYFGLAG